MNTYIIRNGHDKPGRKVRAKNIDNLRKNLALKMKVKEKRMVYDTNDNYVGGLFKLANRTTEAGWPSLMWRTYENTYAVDPKNGTLGRRF